VLIDSDIPHLPPEWLEDALAVLRRTLDVAACLGLQVVQRSAAFDVDDYAGLQRLERLLEEDTSIPALHTRAWLNQNTF